MPRRPLVEFSCGDVLGDDLYFGKVLSQPARIPFGEVPFDPGFLGLDEHAERDRFGFRKRSPVRRPLVGKFNLVILVIRRRRLEVNDGNPDPNPKNSAKRKLRICA